MRDYAKVCPQFWIGPTGKALRKAGPEAQIVALYLMTSPHANMLGLYWLPELYLQAETGLGIEGASKGLAWAIEAGFCKYDEASEMVWVPEMARYQIAERLEPADKRCKGIQKDLAALPESPFIQEFMEIYGAAFNLKIEPKTVSPSEAPSKPLRSQEQEQEQEQEQKPIAADASSPAAPSVPHRAIIDLYNEVLGSQGLTLVKPALWKGSRETNLRARWREAENRQSLEWWRGWFEYIAKSEFLMGKASGQRPFRADLEWLVTFKNFAKVCEGKYHG